MTAGADTSQSARPPAPLPPRADTVPWWRAPALQRALLAALVAVAAALLYGFHLPDVVVRFELRSTLPGQGELFWAEAGQRHAAARSQTFPARADGEWHAHEVRLPAGAVRRLRFDPGSGPGQFALRNLVVSDGRRAIGFDVRELRAWRGDTRQVLPAGRDGFAFDSFGRDPYVEVRLPVTVGAWSAAAQGGRLAGVGLLAGLAWLLLEWLSARLPGRLRAPRWAARLAERLGDDDVLRVDARMLLAFAVLAVAAALYVALALNQSSIGMWEHAYPDRPVAQAIDLGSAKRVRTDEWKVQTPWVFNQLDAGAPWRNRDIGGLSSPLLASMPVHGVLGWPHVKFAGFRLFGPDRGLSWWWAYKTFGLAAAFLWLLLILTRGNLAAALLGTAWIWCSSFTQWWLSSNLPEILVAFALGMVGALYALCSAKRGWIVAGCVLVVYALANCALNLYPPFLLPLGWLGLALLGGWFARRGALRLPLADWRFRVGALAAAVLAGAAYLAAFFHAAAASVQAMRDTVYPGHRALVDWEVAPAKLLSGFFEGFRLGEHAWPLHAFNANACEASGFLLLAPLILLLLPPRAWRERDNGMLLAALAFCALSFVWILWAMAPPVRWLGALAGWSMVPPKRALLGLGIASILACCLAFARARDRVPHPRAAAAAVLVLSAGVGLLGLWLRRLDPGFFSPTVLALGWLAATLLAGAVASGRTRLLAAGIAICALPTLAVNPLQSGASALLDKPILRAAARVDGAAAGRWAVIGDNFFAQGLRAQGLSVLGGAQYLPDFAAMARLDPGKRQARVWNRYAYVSIASEPGRHAPLFRQTRGDQYTIVLDVCRSLRGLGVTHLAYTSPVPDADRACLEPLPAPADSGVRLFRLRATR